MTDLTDAEIEEMRGRATEASKLSGWLYDDYDGGTNLEVLAGLLAHDTDRLLAALEEARAGRDRLRLQIIKAGEAFHAADEDEAYHQLYAALDPGFQSRECPFKAARRALNTEEGEDE